MTRDEMIETLNRLKGDRVGDALYASRRSVEEVARQDVAALDKALAALRAPVVTGEVDRGSWPSGYIGRAFVAGAAWWQFAKHGSTPFPSERDEMEAEAVRRYGDPAAPPAAGAPPDEARDALSRLALWLGVGMGDDSTTVASYESRIRDGVEMHERAVTAIWRDKHEAACNTIGQLQRERAVLTAQIRAGAPPALVALVAKWREEADGDYSQQADRMRDCADDLESTLGSPAPAPVAPPAETRPVGTCAAHDVLACEVCLTDEAFAPPAVVGGDAPPEIQVGDEVTYRDSDGREWTHEVHVDLIRWLSENPELVVVKIERLTTIFRRRQEGQ